MAMVSLLRPGATVAAWCYHVSAALKHRKNGGLCVSVCDCLISNLLMDFTMRIRINENTSGWNLKCVFPRRHMATAHICLSCSLPYLLSHEALFKYFNPECPSLQPIYFIWWGELRTAWSWEKHTKWVWNLRISTAASSASSPHHLLSPNPPLS